jgi:uncharacterized protein (UPF0297 family)
VYVKCPVEVCRQRDVKGLYKQVEEGKIKGFTGIDDPYEEPEHPELVIETDKETIEESVTRVFDRLEELGYLAEEGKIKGFTDKETIEESVTRVFDRLEELGYLAGEESR